MSKIYKTFVLVYSGYYNRIPETEWLISSSNASLTVLDAEMSKIKLLSNSMSDEILLSDLNIGSSDLSSHMSERQVNSLGSLY